MMDKNKGLIISGSVILIAILLDAVFVHHHAYYWWHGFIGFDIVYGFLGCLLLIMVSKSLGKMIIQRKEDYYEGGDDGDA